jgi:hypothetical protein
MVGAHIVTTVIYTLVSIFVFRDASCDRGINIHALRHVFVRIVHFVLRLRAGEVYHCAFCTARRVSCAEENLPKIRGTLQRLRLLFAGPGLDPRTAKTAAGGNKRTLQNNARRSARPMRWGGAEEGKSPVVPVLAY